MRSIYRFTLAALTGACLLVGIQASHAGDAKVFSGSQCQPYGYASEAHIVRRGIAAVNLDDNLGNPQRWVICPIIRDRIATVDSWPGVVVRVNTLHNFGDTRALSCYLYSMDRWGSFLAMADWFSHTRHGYGTYVLEGGKRLASGYDALICLLPYQAELRAYTVTE